MAALAAELDATVARIGARNGEADAEALSVMAGLAVLSRLHAAQDEVRALKARVATLEADRANAALERDRDDAAVGAAIEAAAEAIERHVQEIVREINGADALAPRRLQPSSVDA